MRRVVLAALLLVLMAGCFADPPGGTPGDGDGQPGVGPQAVEPPVSTPSQPDDDDLPPVSPFEDVWAGADERVVFGGKVRLSSCPVPGDDTTGNELRDRNLCDPVPFQEPVPHGTYRLRLRATSPVYPVEVGVWTHRGDHQHALFVNETQEVALSLSSFAAGTQAAWTLPGQPAGWSLVAVVAGMPGAVADGAEAVVEVDIVADRDRSIPLPSAFPALVPEDADVVHPTAYRLASYYGRLAVAAGDPFVGQTVPLATYIAPSAQSLVFIVTWDVPYACPAAHTCIPWVFFDTLWGAKAVQYGAVVDEGFMLAQVPVDVYGAWVWSERADIAGGHGIRIELVECPPVPSPTGCFHQDPPYHLHDIDLAVTLDVEVWRGEVDVDEIRARYRLP